MGKLFLFIAILMFVGCGNSENQKKEKDAACAESCETKQKGGDAHNAKNSLDFQGTYESVIPCADCEGIEVAITLTETTYVRTMKYLGGKNAEIKSDNGSFKWNEAGNTIILQDTKIELANQYFVGENTLKQLDKDGNVITGEFADKYTYKKLAK